MIVPQLVEQRIRLVLPEHAFYSKKKYRNQIECPTCKQKGCFEHCNHCGDPIKWKDEQGEARYENRKRTIFNTDFSIHKCMLKGTKDGQYYDTGTTFKPINIREYDYHQQHYMCIECAREYNKLVYPVCPSCWKKRCRKCHNMQSWIFRTAEDLNRCFKCGNDRLDLVHTWSSYSRLYGRPTF